MFLPEIDELFADVVEFVVVFLISSIPRFSFDEDGFLKVHI